MRPSSGERSRGRSDEVGSHPERSANGEPERVQGWSVHDCTVTLICSENQLRGAVQRAPTPSSVDDARIAPCGAAPAPDHRLTRLIAAYPRRALAVARFAGRAASHQQSNSRLDWKASDHTSHQFCRSPMAVPRCARPLRDHSHGCRRAPPNNSPPPPLAETASGCRRASVTCSCCCSCPGFRVIRDDAMLYITFCRPVRRAARARC